VIAGHRVAFGILDNGGIDPQYDHIVTVIKIGTNHAPDDASYYPDDVMYFDDHGVYTLSVDKKGKWSFAANPSIPLGAGADKRGCTPYIFAYSFASLVKTRSQENASRAPAYAVVMPDSRTTVETNTGNSAKDGDGTTKIHGPHNAAFAITGPIDTQGVTLPVSLAILGTSTLVKGTWVPNPADHNSSPAALYNYENPYIGGPVGKCDDSNCLSNRPPPAMNMTLQASIRGLTRGVAYNLYEYDFPMQSGTSTGTAAALPIPTANFNAHRGKASAVTSFVAQSATFSTPALARSSSEIIVFRAVPANAP